MVLADVTAVCGISDGNSGGPSSFIFRPLAQPRSGTVVVFKGSESRSVITVGRELSATVKYKFRFRYSVLSFVCLFESQVGCPRSGVLGGLLDLGFLLSRDRIRLVLCTRT